VRSVARLLAVLGLALALGAAGITVFVLGGPDGPPPVDADLIVEFPEVLDDLNGYVALQEALERKEDFASAARTVLELPFFLEPHFEIWEDSWNLKLSWSDLRDGEPLRYSPGKRVVYSVGDDFIDEGGAEEGGPGFPREPTFPIEF